jgi:glutamine amidotransferase
VTLWQYYSATKAPSHKEIIRKKNMCRLLYVKSENEFSIKDHLEKFADISKNSEEYQGHGWGCAYLIDNKWVHYKSIIPVWEDEFSRFGKSKLLLAHARSAFQDRDIVIENNMPFYDDRYVFIFNGELRGVKINSAGRIGAEKIFNFIKRFDKGNILDAIEKGVNIIIKRTTYIRAMNFIITDGNKAFVSSLFNEDENYFTMHYKKSRTDLVICSDPYTDENDWLKIKNKSIEVFE